MRVRSLQMNDAHLYMTPEQFEAEFNAVNEMYLNYFKLFGIEKYLMRFSTHDPAKLGQKFVDEPELWKKTEEMTRNVLKNSGINYVEVPNEAAFYGPKIDVQAWSVIGREFSIATNQVDFAQPRSFDLRYKDRDNIDKIPICIHRAPLGTHERFIGFLIEHYAGNFPLWLSPEQVRILTIGDDPKLLDYARSILNELRAHQVRAEIDESTDKINGKIQRAEQMKVHTMFVIGKRDMEANAVSVRVHGKGNLGAKPRVEAHGGNFARQSSNDAPKLLRPKVKSDDSRVFGSLPQSCEHDIGRTFVHPWQDPSYRASMPESWRASLRKALICREGRERRKRRSSCIGENRNLSSIAVEPRPTRLRRAI